jgi:hypothetical protein
MAEQHQQQLVKLPEVPAAEGPWATVEQAEGTIVCITT